MSRLIVKNLPKHITEDRLREHFSQTGLITDVKLKYTKEKVFRRFCFIGYKTAEEAQKAIDFFNQTYIDTSKIQVEIAKSLNDPNLPRPWSKYSQKTTNFTSTSSKLLSEKAFNCVTARQKKKINNKNKNLKAEQFLNELYNGSNKDEKFQEFLEVTKPRSTRKIWENEDASLEKKQFIQYEDESGESDCCDYQDVDFSESQVEHSELFEESEKKSSELLEVCENGRLFIRNLSYEVTEEDLSRLFEIFGPLASLHIPIDKAVGRSYGIAYVLFVFPEHAFRAWQALDGTCFQGRLLHILPSEGPNKRAEVTDESSFSLKEKKELERKKNAQSDYNWNLLFMKSDTVAEAVARKLRVKKAELLSMDCESMAVRLALGETSVIHETKQYFERIGVVLDAFRTSSKRSDVIIIVKNIPFDIEMRDLSNLFGKFGDLKRIVLPPSKTIALVEFLHANDAKKAFQSLCYTKFKSVPLYLEWAPENCLVNERTPTINNMESKSIDLIGSDSDDENRTGCTVFIKNINFETKEESLKTVFQQYGKVRSMTIARKKDPKNNELKSMGFGFVEFYTPEDAANLLKNGSNIKIDGHILELKLSQKNSRPKRNKRKYASQNDKLKGTKLLVRNVPFEASVKELRELFGTFGKLKSARIPKKFDGSHRGFAFVEFANQQEAQNAFEALASTHFYGRHLVIEWAKDDSSLEKIRADLIKQVNIQHEENHSKKIKFNTRENFSLDSY